MTPAHRQSRWQSLDLPRIIKTGLIVGISAALVWAAGYLYGTVNGWQMHLSCEEGTAQIEELC